MPFTPPPKTYLIAVTADECEAGRAFIAETMRRGTVEHESFRDLAAVVIAKFSGIIQRANDEGNPNE